MSINPQTPGAGHKPLHKRTQNPSSPHIPSPSTAVVSSPAAPLGIAPSPTPVKPKQKTRSNGVAPQPPQPTTMQTRSSNKDKHPGLAQKALDTVRQTSEDVQAEKDQKKIAAEAAEKERIDARDRLVAFEDSAQRSQDHYKQNFAKPAGNPDAKKNPDSGDYPDADGDTESPRNVQDNEQPDDSDNGGGKRARKKKTSRAEVSQERAVSASTPIITKAPTTATAATIPRKRKSPAQPSGSAPPKKQNVSTKDTTPPVKAGLKKAQAKKSVPITSAADESMLREGESVGFADDKAADTREKLSTTNIPVPVKIQDKPLQLAVGRNARGDGKKFSARHLPDFIRENEGDRRILYPLSKEAVGHVHSWGLVKSKAVQSIVDRGSSGDQGEWKYRTKERMLYLL
ncbi:hypothetical protein AAF712_016719 [Marasmius tenuissimus]|uniref:Uncharacterized protein n=1 Tax=Marasmius tenuissimus TaxID=585030 RepID=A0ABR2Z554_9AGAR